MSILLLTFAIVFFLTATGAQGIALTLAGIIAPLLAHLVKGGAHGRAAVLIAVVVSAVVAVIATYIAGDIHNLGDLIKNISAVFGVATLVYKLIALGPPAPAVLTGKPI